MWPREVAMTCGWNNYNTKSKWRLWGSLPSNNPWRSMQFPLNKASLASPGALFGLGLGQWTLSGLVDWLIPASGMVFSLLWEIVTYSFLAVTISDVKSLFSNFLRSDTYNGLGGRFAIILFQYLWNCAASYGFWAFKLPFRYPSHKFSMIITSQLENIHLYALFLGQRKHQQHSLMLLSLLNVYGLTWLNIWLANGNFNTKWVL